jgi:hypothetical protein
MKDGVALRSEMGREVTTIDGEFISGFQPVVVNSRNTTIPSTKLEGFTVTSTGNPIRGLYLLGDLVVRDCRFLDLDAFDSGGGGITVNGNLVISGCEIRNCRAWIGGAIYHANGTIEMYDCVVRECGNPGVWLQSNPGGPVESALIEDCLFEDNGDDGALSVSYGTANSFTIRRCVFRNNTEAGTGGGGIGIGGNGPKLIEECLFVGNHSTGGNGGGAGLRTDEPATIRNNTFWGNSSLTNAGGSALEFVDYDGIGYDLINNVIAGGMGPGGAIQAQFGGVNSSCNIFWSNEGGDGLFFDPGPTDREVDPLFCDVEAEDFTVDVHSPCLPGNSMGCGLIGAFGEGCGTISVDPSSWGAIKNAYRRFEEDAR